MCCRDNLYCDGTKKCISLLAERDTATYNIQQLFTLVKDIASRHNFNFIPEKLVECASRNAATDTFQKEKEIP